MVITFLVKKVNSPNSKYLVGEPCSESATFLTLDLLHGTVFHTISIKLETLVFSSTASKLNYFVEHMSLALVSALGRSVNSAIEVTILLLLLSFLHKYTGCL